jgi:Rrf2 family transcriptional regulator, nitric oxide-sensitive transcriptional repressor
MRLTAYTDYALRLLIHAAAKAPALVTITEAANAFRLSKNHLMKIINDLARAGYVATVRGRHGGFTLAKPASEIHVGDVIRFAERDAVLVECFDRVNNRCVITPACRLKDDLYQAQENFYTELNRRSVADLFESPKTVLKALNTP